MPNNDYLVLENAPLTNNGTMTTNNGTVVLSGDANANNATISGNTLNFYNLQINKSANNAKLDTDIQVQNNLDLTSGKLVLDVYDLEMGDNVTFSNINKDRYIVTNSVGTLIRKVSNSYVVFPVGKSTFNPVKLKNDGVTDLFNIRIIDHFYLHGTSGSALTTNVVPRVWLIDEAVVGRSDVTMRLMWRSAHLAGSFDPNASHISHYTGGGWQDQTTGSATADNSFGSDHKYRQASNITSFSPFGVRSGAPLPVELLFFHGEQEEDAVRLDWQTATEINNDYFDVEWSTSPDASGFVKIGQVDGAGNTVEVQSYDFLHTTPIVGSNYYRLKQVDFDTKFEYSSVIHVVFHEPSMADNATLSIFPNPVLDDLNVRLSPTLYNNIKGNILIYNSLGQLVKEVVVDDKQLSIPVTLMPPGQYVLKLVTKDDRQYVERFLKL